MTKAHKKDLNAGYADFQHRHFATIAHIIRNMPDDLRERVTEEFANNLRYTNAKFDRERFVAACKA